MKRPETTLVALSLLILAAGCSPPADTPEEAMNNAAAGKSAKPDVVMSPGKPTAPISMSYEILGTPVVGSPVQINVEVSSPQGPVEVRYSIADPGALVFQAGQVERLEIRDPSRREPRQLAVIPQREGRVYVNVSAEVLTPGGSMIRSMAIPIRVGAAREVATPNGELVEGPDGETVISMPAAETPPN